MISCLERLVQHRARPSRVAGAYSRQAQRRTAVPSEGCPEQRPGSRDISDSQQRQTFIICKLFCSRISTRSPHPITSPTSEAKAPPPSPQGWESCPAQRGTHQGRLRRHPKLPWRFANLFSVAGLVHIRQNTNTTHDAAGGLYENWDEILRPGQSNALHLVLVLPSPVRAVRSM